MSDAKAQALSVATVARSAASAIVSDAQVAADPTVNALGMGLTAAADAYLTQALDPAGEAIVGPAANTLIALGEAKAHDLSAALFANAKTQLAPAAKPA